MKKIFFILAIIASITACTKSEAQSPEPEPVQDTTSKSYVGCMRSDYPDIAIPGISVNDKIVYDLKTACTYNSSYQSTADTEFYVGALTLQEIAEYYAFPIAAISVSTDESNDFTYIYIQEKTFDFDEIRYHLYNGKVLEKTANIESVDIKEATVIQGNEYFKPDDTCKFDIEIKLKYGNTIEIVYYGKSFRLYIVGDNPDMK